MEKCKGDCISLPKSISAKAETGQSWTLDKRYR